MPLQPRRRSWPLIAIAALFSWLLACQTEQIQLDPTENELSSEGGVAESSDVACLGVGIVLGDGHAMYDILVNDRLVRFGLEPYTRTVGQGSSLFCLNPGSYSVSVRDERGKLLIKTGKLALEAGQQWMVIIYGDPAHPEVLSSPVNMTPLGQDLRSMRVTNVAADRQPVRLIYYDSDDEEVARSPLIAFGDTDISTIPADALYWRLTTSQQRPFVVSGGNADAENNCVELQAAGVVIMDALREEASFETYYSEYYIQVPPSCTLRGGRADGGVADGGVRHLQQPVAIDL